MKCLVIFISIIACSRLNYAAHYFLPNLPVGEYILYPRAFIICRPEEIHLIQYNLYLYKISSNESEIRGNLTLKTAFDDSFNFHLNMAVKDSIGGWKDNAIVYQATKACTSVTKMMGPAIQILSYNFGANWSCPIPAGLYISKGLDFMKLMKNSNFPKQLFYGSYKLRIEILDNKNIIIGCTIGILDVKRPWEME